MKPIYAFDIDGVLCSTKEVHKAEIEAELGVTLQDGGNYMTFGFSHDSEEVMSYLMLNAMDLWRRPTVFANGEASGQDVLWALHERGQFAGYVTRRHPDLYDDTIQWLFESKMPEHRIVVPDFGHIASALAGKLHHMDGDIESKAGPARDMGADTLVEDSAREALDAARDGLNVVVLRMPYNRLFEEIVGDVVADRVRFEEYPEVTPDVAARIRFIDSLEELP